MNFSLAQVVANTVITGSLYALVTVGFALTYNTGGFFNMAHGAVFLVGAYVGYAALRIPVLGLPAAVILAAAAAGLGGLLLYQFVVRRLQRKRAHSLVLFIASLGVLVAAEGLAAVWFGNETLVFIPGPSPSLGLFSARITLVQAWILALAASLFLCLLLFFQRTNLGKRIRAVADDRELAESIGIPVGAVLPQVFFWGSVLAGVAGLLVGLDRTIRPGSGMVAILWAMVASIVGGVGSYTGPVVGAFLLGFLENIMVVLFPSEWKSTFVFSSLILFLFFRPAGLFGVEK